MITYVPAHVSPFDGKRLRAAREAKRWTQGRLSVKSGKGISSVYGWEAGSRTPDPKTIKHLADVLGIEAGELLNVPPEHYSLYEHRIINGLTQVQVAKHLGVSTARVGHFEAAYVELEPAAVITQLAKLYRTTEDEIMRCWQRSRDLLTADDDDS